MRILISACLLGCRCRYDGASRPQPWIASRNARIPARLPGRAYRKNAAAASSMARYIGTQMNRPDERKTLQSSGSGGGSGTVKRIVSFQATLVETAKSRQSAACAERTSLRRRHCVQTLLGSIEMHC